MSLGIFSFDLAALIDSLSHFIETTEENFPAGVETGAGTAAETAANEPPVRAAVPDEALMAAALAGAVTALLQPAEPVKPDLFDALKAELAAAAAPPDKETDRKNEFAPEKEPDKTPVENSAPTAVVVKPSATTVKPPPRPPLDEATRREIEQLIKSLQTSVIHNYRSSDIIDESVARRLVTDFPQRVERQTERDGRAERVRDEQRRAEQRLENLRADLKKAILRNNSGV